MTPKQLFAISVRILGVYLLVQAVMQVPAGLVEGAMLIVYWTKISTNAGVAVPMLYESICTAVISFVVFIATGIYLVMGAPHLMRFIRIDDSGARQG